MSSELWSHSTFWISFHNPAKPGLYTDSVTWLSWQVVIQVNRNHRNMLEISEWIRHFIKNFNSSDDGSCSQRVPLSQRPAASRADCEHLRQISNRRAVQKENKHRSSILHVFSRKTEWKRGGSNYHFFSCWSDVLYQSYFSISEVRLLNLYYLFLSLKFKKCLQGPCLVLRANRAPVPWSTQVLLSTVSGQFSRFLYQAAGYHRQVGKSETPRGSTGC